MVGDESGVTGFEPLDGPNSQVRHTAALFAAMTKNADANKTFIEAASARAQSYEEAFAKAAVAEPLLADRGAAQDLFSRRRGCAASSLPGHMWPIPHRKSPPSHPNRTRVPGRLADCSPGGSHIEERFFRDGRLLSPSEIAEEDWSIYDTQLAVYLAPWPRIFDAIQQFGHTYDTIATGQ